MKAIDVIKARSDVSDFVFPKVQGSVEKRLEEGLRRMTLAVGTTGQKIPETDSMIVPTVAYLINSVIVEETDPAQQAVNYYLAPRLTETIERIAAAMDDDMPAGDIPAPSIAGFCLLGEPLRWTDAWGLATEADLVTWAPSRNSHGEPFTSVTLWTRNMNSEAMRDLMSDWELRTRRGWLGITHGWHIVRLVMIAPQLAAGPPTFTVREEEVENDADGDLVAGTVFPNFDRLVLALWAVLAGADAPGSDRVAEKVTEQPGKDLARTAKKRGVPGAVSFIYAGTHRTPTPPENVGSRGPIGVYYWRNGFTKRYVRPDGSIGIRRRKGTWCGDPANPVSDRTKVRIAKGTVAKPSDVMAPS